MDDDYIGQEFGNHQLLRVLGRGNFAAVYLAEHRFLDIPRAIKLLHVRLDEDMYEHFRREARIIAHLRHPHIVTIYDFGVEKQMPYLVMEYMPHGTMRTRYPKGTRVPFEQIIAYVKQIAPALDYAHEQRVIHRDIKPDNILLNANDEAVISDFGIAVALQTLDPNASSLLKPAGTPLYMAPEQIDRQPCPASDQYALGILVYEWIAGEPPFQGSSYFEIWSKHIHQPPPSLRARVPHLSAAVEDAVFGALAKDPRERFVTVQDFATALEEACFATDPHLLFTPTPIVERTQPRPLPARPQDTAQAQAVAPASPQAEREGPQTPQVTTQAGSKQFRSSIAPVNRLRLLKRVRSFWIDGVLQHSLHGAALIALGLQEQPDAVASAWPLALQTPDAPARPLPGGTQITQIYDQANGELLILGAPGCGKTTLLLALARDLLKRAEQDETHPVPVVFNLSSWALKKQALTDWLVEELLSKYQVPRKLGRALVEAEQILPLLDGLDEVMAKERTACIEAINAYRQEYGLLPMIVCCRRADYLASITRVLLDCAVIVQPLTEQQIDTYLKQGGAPLRTLRLALHQDAELRDLASTPLMLSILTLTYQGVPVEHLLHSSAPGMLQRQVFEHYVQRMLASRGGTERYTPAQVIHWLSCLARQLALRNQTMFFLERVQPDWLESRWARQRYPIVAASLVFFLLGILCLGPLGGFLIKQVLSSWSVVNLGISLLGGLVIGLLFGLFNGLLYRPGARVPVAGPGPARRTPDKKRWSWKRGAWRLVRSMLNGGLVGLLLGLPYGLVIVSYHPGTPQDAVIVLVAIFLIGLLSGSIFLVVDTFLGIQIAEIRPIETFVWSWGRMMRSFVKFLGLGLLGLLLIGFVFGFLHGLYDGYVANWTQGAMVILADIWLGEREFIILFGPFFAVACGLIGALTGGLSTDMLDEHNLTRPNQGMHRSAQHSLLIGSIGLIVGGVVGGWFGYETMPAHDLQAFIVFALIFGPLIGVVSALRTGGIACLQHLVLRWLLWETGVMPWHYTRFLDYAAEHVLLSKVGAGYIFVHRLLLEYFASL